MSVDCDAVFMYGIITDKEELQEWVSLYRDESVEIYTDDIVFSYYDTFYEFIVRCDAYSEDGMWLIGFDLPTNESVPRYKLEKEFNFSDLMHQLFPRMPQNLRDEICGRAGFISTIRYW